MSAWERLQFSAIRQLTVWELTLTLLCAGARRPAAGTQADIGSLPTLGPRQPAFDYFTPSLSSGTSQHGRGGTAGKHQWQASTEDQQQCKAKPVQSSPHMSLPHAIVCQTARHMVRIAANHCRPANQLSKQAHLPPYGELGSCFYSAQHCCRCSAQPGAFPRHACRPACSLGSSGLRLQVTCFVCFWAVCLRVCGGLLVLRGLACDSACSRMAATLAAAATLSTAVSRLLLAWQAVPARADFSSTHWSCCGAQNLITLASHAAGPGHTHAGADAQHRDVRATRDRNQLQGLWPGG